MWLPFVATASCLGITTIFPTFCFISQMTISGTNCPRLVLSKSFYYYIKLIDLKQEKQQNVEVSIKF